MTATHTPSFIAPAISSRLIRELPRFFGGVDAMFKEAFQNALRAGATFVSIQIDGGRVTFHDDGRGLDDPQVLFTGGDTAWNEEQVIEPAGLGVFSFLNPEITRSVRFSSREWSVEVTPDILERPIGQEAVERAPYVAGFRINLDSTLPQEKLAQAVRRARGLFPFTVTLNGAPLEPKAYTRMAQLETPFGRFELISLGSSRALLGDHARRYGSSALVPMWEYQPIEDAALIDSVDRPLSDALGGSFALLWAANPASGVRPKLPDRNAWLPNAALDALRAHLPEVARTLRTQAIAEAESTLRSQDDLLRKNEVPGVFGAVMEALSHSDGMSLIARAGFELLGIPSYSSEVYATFYSDGESSDIEGVASLHYLKRRSAGVAVSDEDTATTLNLTRALTYDEGDAPEEMGGDLGAILAHVDEAAAETTYLRGGEAVKLNDELMLDWVEEIRCGELTLPFILREEMPYVVIAAPKWDDIEPSEWMGKWIFDQETERTYAASAYDTLHGEWPTDDDSLRSDDYVDHVVTELRRTYSGKAEVMARIEDLEAQVAAIGTAIDALWSEALRSLRAPLEAKRAELQTEIHSLQSEHDL